ncbi:MAG: HDOD domain-containing protein [Syntrophobacterales bacterium]|jgi:putative nucleotidyltransferase with HDIG domain|nr:HDOD domain-containing protein [Syntrophobacterales bacterium]
MKNNHYRLILEGFAIGTNVVKVVPVLKKMGVAIGKIQHLLVSPPRIIKEYESLSDAEHGQNLLTKLGALILLDPVISYPDFPYFLSKSDDRIIKKELSKILRTRSNMTLLLTEIQSPGSRTLYPSVFSLLEEFLNNLYRETDTVIAVDENHFLVLGFASDKLGLSALQNKTLRGLKQHLGEDVLVKFGHSIFPGEAQSIEKLLQQMIISKDADYHLSSDISSPGPGLEVEKKQTIEMNEDDQWSPIQLCFLKGQGPVFSRLISMEPQILWLGLSQMPSNKQRDFIARLPFDSPLISALEKFMADQEHSGSSVETQAAERHFSAIINQMDLMSSIIQRDKKTEEVLSILKQTNDLPILPIVASQIFKIASDPNYSNQELADLITRDPALTSKLLKTVNSAFYGSHQKISSIKYAASLLGAEEIVDIAFGLAVAKVFDSHRLREWGNPQVIWHHSFCTAMILKYLYKMIPDQKNEGVFSAGLLHDVGKIFFIEHDLKFYHKTVAGHSLFEFEETDFGINHAEVGKHLAIRWNLPDSLVHAIAYHHEPFMSSYHAELAAMTGLADYLYHRAMEEYTKEVAYNKFGQCELTHGHLLCLPPPFNDLGGEKLESLTETVWTIMEENQSYITLTS